MTQERWPNHDTYIAHMGTRVCGHLSAHSRIGASLDSAFANSQASVDIVANQIADSIIGGDSSGLQYALSDFFELFLGD